MRDIKFRGFDEENKCWRYGHFFETIEGIRMCYNIVENKDTKYYVRCDSIGQFTNLQDKNGKERYEGNIFKSRVCLSPDGISSAHNISYWIDVYCTIVFKNGSFLGEWKISECNRGKYTFSKRSGYVKLSENDIDIGNIHENEELLK